MYLSYTECTRSEEMLVLLAAHMAEAIQAEQVGQSTPPAMVSIRAVLMGLSI